MSWRLRVRHVTTFSYEEPVVASYNEARLTPSTASGQTTIDTSVEVSPQATLLRYRDHWGSLVHAFDLHRPHDRLTVTGQAVVETAPPCRPCRPCRPAGAADWDELASETVADRLYEYLGPSAYVTGGPFAEVAAGLRAGCASPAEAVAAVAAWTNEQLSYERGATHVATSAAEAWEAGRGVCQDFAHVSLAVLRAMGVPARYVSGYLHPKAEAVPGVTEMGESHAWVEAWTGTWCPVDPTNLVPVGERYVVVARGRDYRDVAPIKGIYSGHGRSTAEAVVEVTRLS